MTHSFGYKVAIPHLIYLKIFFVCCALLFLNSLTNANQSHTLGREMKVQDVETGTLLLEDGSNRFHPAPVLETVVDIRVTGLIARTKVTQYFMNPSSEWIEGIYVFPLPEMSAVDTLKMIIGERTIIGEIEERSEAKKIYEQAKSDGKKASLLEQERPNIFTSSVANIGPNEQVAITIEYQEELRYDQGEFSVRFPMVVGPRYIPGATAISSFSSNGWSRDTDQVPDASRITPSVHHPKKGSINPVSITATIDAGFAAVIKSPSHQIKTTESDSIYTIELSSLRVPADSDFILEWRPTVGDAPNAALFSDEFNGDTYALLMVMPPIEENAEHSRLPRETIFIIDTSGSMEGTSLQQAKASLRIAVNRLDAKDSFNIIQFNSYTQSLFPTSQVSTKGNIGKALRYVDSFAANGGTEMLSALQSALTNQGRDEKVRQVIFITDGSIGNEEAVFRYIKQNLGGSRLFTVGIGSAPNSYFMRKAAEYGLGTFTYIGYASEIKKKMVDLFSKLESPVLTNIEIDWQNRSVETWPKKVPDLYLGEPIIITARLPNLGGDIEIKGRRGAKHWQLSFELEGGSKNSGIDKLYARRKVAALTSSLEDGADAKEVQGQIVTVGKAHHIVTAHTSLVAVEQISPLPKNALLKTKQFLTNLPRGWKFESGWGSKSGTNQGSPNSNPQNLTSPVPHKSTPTSQTGTVVAFHRPGQLPKTATPAMLLVILGMGLLGAADWLRRKLAC